MLRWKGMLTKLAQVHKKKTEEVEKAFGKYDGFSCRGLLTTLELKDKMFEELNIKVDKDFDFLEFSMRQFSPILETHRFAKKISRRLPVGLLTNIHHGFYHRALHAGQIPRLRYRAVIQSCLLGKIKPEKEIYLHAQKEAKTPHNNILFIDDLPKNIEAAADLGWQTVLFETDNPKKSLKEINDLLGVRP